MGQSMGQFEGFIFIRKCNDPNGLSRDLTGIQRLMSYRLDDPGSVANITFNMMSQPLTEGQLGQTQHSLFLADRLRSRDKSRLCSVCSDYTGQGTTTRRGRRPYLLACSEVAHRPYGTFTCLDPLVQARACAPSWMSSRKSLSRLYSSGAMNSMRIFSALPGIGFSN